MNDFQRGRRWRTTRLLLIVVARLLTACAATPGTIAFGQPDDPQLTFSLDANAEISWTASLSRRVEETSVNLVITPEGSDTEVFGYQQFITEPDSTTLSNEMPLGRFLPDPGVYIMRYVSVSGEVLAEGRFELVE